MNEIENFYPKPQNINQPFKDLDLNLDGSFLELVKPKWWLIKFEDLYQVTYDYHFNQYLYKEDNGTVIRLPPCMETTKDQKFINIYEELNQVIELHKNENYFKEQISNYHKIKDSKSVLKNWVVKNEQLVDSEYVSFGLDFLQYSDDIIGHPVEHLKVSFIYSKETEILIKSDYFKYTIEFLEIFNELFWVQEIYPESKTLQKCKNVKVMSDEEFNARFNTN